MKFVDLTRAEPSDPGTRLVVEAVAKELRKDQPLCEFFGMEIYVNNDVPPDEVWVLPGAVTP